MASSGATSYEWQCWVETEGGWEGAWSPYGKELAEQIEKVLSEQKTNGGVKEVKFTWPAVDSAESTSTTPAPPKKKCPIEYKVIVGGDIRAIFDCDAVQVRAHVTHASTNPSRWAVRRVRRVTLSDLSLIHI